MKKLLTDTLQTNGKWSKKSLTILTTHIIMISLSTFVVISDILLDKIVNPYAIQIITALLGFEILLLGLTEAGKKFTNKN